MANTFSFEDASTPATTANQPATFSFEDAATPPPATPKKSLLRQYADIHPGIAAGETGLNLATGALATPLSGLAGLGTAAGRALGLTNADPADVTRRVGSALTYEPKTEGGKTVTDIVTKPFQWLGQGADTAGSAVAEATGSPLAGAAVNTGLQALPMAVGKVGAKPAAARLAKQTEALETQKKINAPMDANIAAARDLNYVLPPAVGGATGPLSSFFQGVAGSTKLDYGASFKNQRVTNNLIKKELGLAADDAITKESLADYRSKFSDAYEGVKKAVPDLQITPEFKAAIQNPNSKYAQARKEFPNVFKNKEIEALSHSLTSKNFTSGAAIELQKKLRADGYDNLKAFDNPSKKALGEAQINAAHAIDGLIDQNLAMKAPPGVKNFQSKLTTNLADARKRIAQSYAVEKALNDATGNVSARTLAKIWEKSGGFTGGLLDVAKTAKAFEKQLRDVDKLPGAAKENVSNLDVAKATGLAALGHGALGAVATAGRAAVAPALLSNWYQMMNVKPRTYQPGLAYTLPNQVLNSSGYPILTIPQPPQEN